MRYAILVALCLSFPAGSEQMAEPRYNGDQLIRPEGFREWMFVGANYGMGYTEPDGTKAERPKTFHNIYLQREAYRHYVQTGKFPDKTMLVMEVIRPGINASINKQGMFEDAPVGIEVALKDEQRYPDKWAYFNFIGSGGKPLPEAKPFPKQACWQCHNDHAAVDNVFVQFYPVLREARK
ncbi:MAG: hypothetical protein FJW20_22550 [Acidimicrobiia bacterium]|nr:hypothetical protein [Acidimicrobiia bacterium]